MQVYKRERIVCQVKSNKFLKMHSSLAYNRSCQITRFVKLNKMLPPYQNICPLTFSCNFDHSSYSKNYCKMKKISRA
jgi:hypothetical protein